MMGEIANKRYAVLDNLIAEHGSEWLVGQIITRMAEGDEPKDIARSLGVHYVYLKRWLEEHAADDIALARRAHSDSLVWDALSEVRHTDVDNLQVAKARADVYLKVAGKASKAEWGDGVQVGGGGMGSITIVIGNASPHPDNMVGDESKVIEGDVI